MKKLVLVSGGVDSKVLLDHVVKTYGRENIHGLFFSFGDNWRHLNAARKHCGDYWCPLEEIPLHVEQTSKEVPFRNLIFLANAMNFAKTIEANQIFLAIKQAGQEYNMRSWYDCSPEFVVNVNWISKTESISIVAPFVNKTTRDVFEYAKKNNVDVYDCYSCDESEDGHCGKCVKCREVAYECRHLGLKTTVPPFDDCYFRIEEFRMYINKLCNLSCHFCSYSEQETRPDYMKDSVLDALIQKLVAWDVRNVMISGKEPLYNMEHFDYVMEKLCRKFDHDIRINTNGYFLHKLKDDWFERLIKVFFSMNYTSICDKIKEIPARFRSIIVPYFVPAFDYTDAYIKKLELDRLKDLGIEQIYIREDVFSDRTDYKEWLELLSGMEFRIEKPNTRRVCERYARTLTILTDGAIAGCSKDTYRNKGQIFPLNIETATLENIKSLYPRKAQICPIMQKEVLRENIFSRWQIAREK